MPQINTISNHSHATSSLNSQQNSTSRLQLYQANHAQDGFHSSKGGNASSVRFGGPAVGCTVGPCAGCCATAPIGAAIGFLVGLPVGGIGAVPGALIGGAIGFFAPIIAGFFAPTP